ncbi:hypothetical protein TI03_01550 [Achromatium sp. WMS1]|nr:hypothetical protein TI03_01550 [Achromatium sp. WMS1]
MNKPLIKLVDLVAGYNEPVVGPLSLQINQGEVIGIWGTNGCGKSTLLKAIANNARIFAGHIEKSSGLTLSWQIQQPIRLEEMPFSCQEYLYYAQAQRKELPKRLIPWLNKRIDKLSGGQFQLLAVWAILGSAANLVLLDEPTNNLDPTSEAILIEILAAEQGKRAILLVSHERNFLNQSCNRVFEIDS